jgi:hypothetical protein
MARAGSSGRGARSRAAEVRKGARSGVKQQPRWPTELEEGKSSKDGRPFRSKKLVEGVIGWKGV